MQNNIKKGGKTPQTQLLYAYTESPILKYEMNAFKGTALQSRKVINFDEEEKLLKKKCIEIAEQDDGLSQTNDFISKKCKLLNNVVRKPPTAVQHINPPLKNMYERR
jgi:aspartyl/asparaginyl-tRNA synthetase